MPDIYDIHGEIRIPHLFLKVLPVVALEDLAALALNLVSWDLE